MPAISQSAGLVWGKSVAEGGFAIFFQEAGLRLCVPKDVFAELTALFNQVEKFGDGFQKTSRPVQGARKEFLR